ncbi:hypothetical protein [Bradyrhizobium sp. MOS002]|uniref:hypothetical protein n=1 Tax=Bradyrhizobium sp. MOS002 TaxID=2133947 RepID=UPI000D138884|nr:hypothetical protein [Bradyrhizobium sp. MOS002]PSO29822.1 hypothetical protein C7G41_24060 [Bradyrhizobium sp. MOS002]
MTQQLDELAKPLVGGKLYLIQAGTTATPQNCYQDTGLTLPWPNPVTLDAAGRVPQLFCADGNIKIRLTDKNGAQKLVQDNLLIVGPSGGGGGGGTVDPTTIFQTGAFMQFYGTGSLTGWVRCNGKTIGSASSGASERANADVQALFQYLWGADANLAVSGGRGASAAADWAANKLLTLPDCRGRVLASLDDMGNTAAGRLTATYFGATAINLGAAGGDEKHILTVNELAGHRHSVTMSDPGHTHQYQYYGTAARQDGTQAATVQSQLVTGTTGASFTGIVIHSIDNVANATDPVGLSLPHAVVQPTILATTFIKL